MRALMCLSSLVLVGIFVAQATISTANAGGEKGKIVTTKSGLKYEDIKEGSGAAATKGDTVQVHYTGWLANGKKFDSSKDRGSPFSFALAAGQVIKGWDEGVQGMKVGGVRKLIIPSDLAYGAEGRPPVIPPNAELTFEVELLKIRGK